MKGRGATSDPDPEILVTQTLATLQGLVQVVHPIHHQVVHLIPLQEVPLLPTLKLVAHHQVLHHPRTLLLEANLLLILLQALPPHLIQVALNSHEIIRN